MQLYNYTLFALGFLQRFLSFLGTDIICMNTIIRQFTFTIIYIRLKVGAFILSY